MHRIGISQFISRRPDAEVRIARHQWHSRRAQGWDGGIGGSGSDLAKSIDGDSQGEQRDGDIVSHDIHYWTAFCDNVAAMLQPKSSRGGNYLLSWVKKNQTSPSAIVHQPE
jgi:hypothetical protein